MSLRHPWQFFWMSGGLSSFLDNAPTYLTFTAMASGTVGSNLQNLGMLLHSPLGETLLAAVSAGRFSWERTRISETARTSW
jgi:Na+/H+ antiporter NhaD/arsenite permease-like protein